MYLGYISEYLGYISVKIAKINIVDSRLSYEGGSERLHDHGWVKLMGESAIDDHIQNRSAAALPERVLQAPRLGGHARGTQRRPDIDPKTQKRPDIG